MKANQVSISACHSCDDCEEMINRIEQDYENTAGGWKAWMSGHCTVLTKSAETKIAKLRAKQERLEKAE